MYTLQLHFFRHLFHYLYCALNHLQIAHFAKNTLRDKYYEKWMNNHQMNEGIRSLSTTLTTNWMDDAISTTQSCTGSITKKLILISISLIYIGYGIVILVLVTNHIHITKSYCNLIKEPKY
eukprot:75010_1